ncbi:MAG: extracellular solute-binding protein, partial [Firmicutes bacterium]|nr:extracellular solute-binding protein [Bacillota bacterium]
MRKSLLSLMAGLTLLLVLLSSVVSAKTVIEVWGIPADDPGKNFLASDFNAIQDEYEIKVVSGAFGFAESPEKLMTAVAAGTAPPVVLLDRMTVADWAARGALMPLDAIAERANIKRSDFVDAVWEACMFNGKLYA